MFVALQATNNVNDSRVVTAIDRTCTDVAFTDSFILFVCSLLDILEKAKAHFSFLCDFLSSKFSFILR